MDVASLLSCLMVHRPRPRACPRCGGTRFHAEKAEELFKGKMSAAMPRKYHVCDRCGYSPDVEPVRPAGGALWTVLTIYITPLILILAFIQLFIPGSRVIVGNYGPMLLFYSLLLGVLVLTLYIIARVAQEVGSSGDNAPGGAELQMEGAAEGDGGDGAEDAQPDERAS